jgi:hypothetical protein
VTKDILTATGSEDILLSAEAMFTNLTDNLKSSGAAAVSPYMYYEKKD